MVKLWNQRLGWKPDPILTPASRTYVPTLYGLTGCKSRPTMPGLFLAVVESPVAGVMRCWSFCSTPTQCGWRRGRRFSVVSVSHCLGTHPGPLARALCVFSQKIYFPDHVISQFKITYRIHILGTCKYLPIPHSLIFTFTKYIHLFLGLPLFFLPLLPLLLSTTSARQYTFKG